jgi:putative tricarboxylic transport membrane protein
MRLPDQVTGSFLVVLGGAAAYGGWLLPPVPGQPVGPNVFPLVIGTGLALCGLAITFGIGHSFEEEEELVPVEPSGIEPGRIEQGGIEQGGIEQGGIEQGGIEQRQAGQDKTTPLAGWLHGLRALLPPALLLFYVVAADFLGFFITAALIVYATSTALGAKWKLALPLAALAPVGIHLIFGKLLRVPLPPGLLPMPW